jgi:hypothetical protein
VDDFKGCNPNADLHELLRTGQSTGGKPNIIGLETFATRPRLVVATVYSPGLLSIVPALDEIAIRSGLRS